MPLVLVVEPDRGIAQLLHDVLEDEGYRVVSARTAREAIRILDREQPQLIIVEERLPDQPGSTLCAAIQVRPAIAAIPLILSSTGNQPMTPSACQYAAVLTKPFHLRTLLAMVETWAPPTTAA